jgi:hypothetical protein
MTRLASNEIFSPSKKIHREVGRFKDLSAPLYVRDSSDSFIDKPTLEAVGPTLLNGANSLLKNSEKYRCTEHYS